MMLNKAIPYRAILRILGIISILIAIYLALRVAFNPLIVTGNEGNYQGPEIGYSFTDTLFNIVVWPTPYGSTLDYTGLGVLLLGLSTTKVRLAYWSLQTALWIIGTGLWYQTLGTYSMHLFIEGPDDFTRIIITLLCSLILLALYIPITRLLRKLILPRPIDVPITQI